MGKRIKKIISKIVDLKSNLVNSIIYFVYYYMPIKSNLVYVESKGGEDLAGNMLRIVEELKKPLYGNMKFVFFVKLQYREKIRKLLDTYKITSYKFVANSLSAGIIMERDENELIFAGYGKSKVFIYGRRSPATICKT